MTEQERQAIKEFAKFEIGDIELGIWKGAEFALSEFRKPSENLVEEIENILCDECETSSGLATKYFTNAAKRIANIAPFNQNSEKEMTDKALRFAEWTCICQLEFIKDSECWEDVNGYRRTTLENFNSPEFETYLNEQK